MNVSAPGGEVCVAQAECLFVATLQDKDKEAPKTGGYQVASDILTLVIVLAKLAKCGVINSVPWSPS